MGFYAKIIVLWQGFIGVLYEINYFFSLGFMNAEINLYLAVFPRGRRPLPRAAEGRPRASRGRRPSPFSAAGEFFFLEPRGIEFHKGSFFLPEG